MLITAGFQSPHPIIKGGLLTYTTKIHINFHAQQITPVVLDLKRVGQHLAESCTQRGSADQIVTHANERYPISARWKSNIGGINVWHAQQSIPGKLGLHPVTDSVKITSADIRG